MAYPADAIPTRSDGYTVDAADWNEIGGALNAIRTKSYDIVVFTSTGTFSKGSFTWAKTVKVRVVGGGGGSGGCASTSGTQRCESAGGGGGGYAEEAIDVTSLSSSETVTIGAAGVAGVAGDNDAGNGGTSSFGAFCSATGGFGGDGAPATSTTGSAVRGYRGVGSGGDINLPGGHGGNGVTTDNGTSPFPSMQNWGGHAGGGMGAQSLAVAALQTVAVAGENYGGGAAGSRNDFSDVALAGAAGAPGIVIVEVYG